MSFIWSCNNWFHPENHLRMYRGRFFFFCDSPLHQLRRVQRLQPGPAHSLMPRHRFSAHADTANITHFTTHHNIVISARSIAFLHVMRETQRVQCVTASGAHSHDQSHCTSTTRFQSKVRDLFNGSVQARSFTLRSHFQFDRFHGFCRRFSVPSLCRGDTIVVSKASWAPSDNGNPSAMTSRRLSSTTARAGDIEVPHHDVRTHARPLLGTLALRCTPEQTHASPTPPLQRILRDDGQECQIHGHIGKNEKTETSENEGDETSTSTMRNSCGSNRATVGGNGHKDNGCQKS